jgi:hypothetical protein
VDVNNIVNSKQKWKTVQMGKKCGISKPLGNEKERNTDLL